MYEFEDNVAYFSMGQQKDIDVRTDFWTTIGRRQRWDDMKQYDQTCMLPHVI